MKGMKGEAEAAGATGRIQTVVVGETSGEDAIATATGDVRAHAQGRHVFSLSTQRRGRMMLGALRRRRKKVTD